MDKTCSHEEDMLYFVLLLSCGLCADAQIHNWASYIGGMPDNNGDLDEPGGKVSTMDAWGHIYMTANNGFLRKYDTDGNLIWQQNTGNNGYSVAADMFGNIYTVGVNGHAFVEKRDSAGNFIWTKFFEGADYGIDVAVNGQGDIYVVGHFTDSTDFDPNVNTHFEDTGGSYIVKLDSGGNFQWVFTRVEEGGNSRYYNAIALDGDGNAYMGVGGGGLMFRAGYVEKVRADGAWVWTYQYPPNGAVSQDVLGIKVTDSNYVYVTGNIDYKHQQFGLLFVQKLDTAKHQIWIRKFGHSTFSREGGIDVDADGNVYAIGSAESSEGFNQWGGVFSYGNPNMFLIKISPTGDTLWSVVHNIPLMSTDESHGYNVAVDDNCGVYLTGVLEGTVDMDDGNGMIMMTGNGLFLQKLLCNSLGVGSVIGKEVVANIYPNPTSGNINISSQDVIHSVEITDVMGRVVYSASPGRKQYEAMPDIADGFYHVTISTDAGSVTEKIVVRK